MIREWLKSGVMENGRVHTDRGGNSSRRGDQPRAVERGPARDGTGGRGPLPQSSVRRYARDGGRSPVLVRYADDYVAMCHSREQAEKVKERLADMVEAPRALPSTRTRRASSTSRTGSRSWGSTSAATSTGRAAPNCSSNPARNRSSGSGNGSLRRCVSCEGPTRRQWCSDSTRSSGDGRPTTGAWSPAGYSPAGPLPLAPHLPVGAVTPIRTSRGAGSSTRYFGKFNKSRQDRWVFGDRGSRWLSHQVLLDEDRSTRARQAAGRRPTTRTWSSTGLNVDVNAQTPPAGREPPGSCEPKAAAALSAGSSCCTPSRNHDPRMSGNSGSSPPVASCEAADRAAGQRP